jgi:hypothetical protein
VISLPSVPDTDFAESLWSLREKGDFVDMMIICHGRKFACHRFILAAKARQPGLRIRIHFIRIRIQHFRMNINPNPDPGL